MYICEICTTAFDTPVLLQTRNTDGEHIWSEPERICPICATAERFHPAERCQCGEWKSKEDTLCPACRTALLRRFSAFADQLTSDEEAQLDNWLDGDTIENRGNWS